MPAPSLASQVRAVDIAHRRVLTIAKAEGYRDSQVELLRAHLAAALDTLRRLASSAEGRPPC